MLLEHRLQPALLLLGRSVLGEDLHVARVGRRAVEDHWGDDAAAHDLADHPVVGVAQPGAEALVRQEQAPEALGLRPLAQRDEDVGVADPWANLLVPGAQCLLLDGVHVLFDERADAADELQRSRGWGEIHVQLLIDLLRGSLFDRGGRLMARCDRAARPPCHAGTGVPVARARASIASRYHGSVRCQRSKRGSALSPVWNICTPRANSAAMVAIPSSS